MKRVVEMSRWLMEEKFRAPEKNYLKEAFENCVTGEDFQRFLASLEGQSDWTTVQEKWRSLSYLD